MADLAINEQLGSLMIGFSVYDALHEEWLFAITASGIDYSGIGEGEFTLARGFLIVFIAILIAVNLSISYKLNPQVVERRGGDTLTGSAKGAVQIIKEKPRQVAVMLLCAGLSLAITYWGLGMRQAFLLFIGFGFVNSGPLFSRMMAKLG